MTSQHEEPGWTQWSRLSASLARFVAPACRNLSDSSFTAAPEPEYPRHD